jgi:hypothetical protein
MTPIVWAILACGSHLPPPEQGAPRPPEQKGRAVAAEGVRLRPHDPSQLERTDFGGCYLDVRPVESTQMPFDHKEVQKAWSFPEEGTLHWSDDPDASVHVALHWEAQTHPATGIQFRWGSCGPGVDVPHLVVPVTMTVRGSVGGWPLNRVALRGEIVASTPRSGFGPTQTCVEATTPALAALVDQATSRLGDLSYEVDSRTLCVAFPHRRPADSAVLTMKKDYRLPVGDAVHSRVVRLEGSLTAVD